MSFHNGWKGMSNFGWNNQPESQALLKVGDGTEINPAMEIGNRF